MFVTLPALKKDTTQQDCSDIVTLTIKMILVLSLAKVTSMALGFFVLADVDPTGGWMFELAKSWPFGLAVIVIVYLFLKKEKEVAEDTKSTIKAMMADWRDNINSLTSRSHEMQDRALSIAIKTEASIAALTTTVAENTRAIDRQERRNAKADE